MNIIVSACLLGKNVKYNGGNNYSSSLMDFLQGHNVIPVCPEVLGGLPVPRKPGEIVEGVVRNEDGTSVDYEYRKGAQIAMDKAKAEKADMVILQSRSPSCGVNEIYDGTFTGKKISGSGIFAQLMKENGFNVVDVEDL